VADELDRLIRKFKNLRQISEEIVDKSVVNNNKILENDVREQLSKGKNSKGQVIQRGYSPGYIKRRQRQGRQTSYVDLHFTGDFYESIVLVPFMDKLQYVFISEIDYAKYLEGKYPNILEIAQLNLEKFTKKTILPNLDIKLSRILR